MSDGPLPRVQEIAAIPGTVFHEVWSTSGAPAPPIDNGADPTTGALTLGTRLRFVDEAASTAQAHLPHPLMHRTETVDYGVVIEGEITLVLDDSEVRRRYRRRAHRCRGQQDRRRDP